MGGTARQNRFTSIHPYELRPTRRLTAERSSSADCLRKRIKDGGNNELTLVSSLHQETNLRRKDRLWFYSADSNIQKDPSGLTAKAESGCKSFEQILSQYKSIFRCRLCAINIPYKNHEWSFQGLKNYILENQRYSNTNRRADIEIST